jgi:DNA-binding winged helix-turn-helix (wHTH) protein
MMKGHIEIFAEGKKFHLDLNTEQLFQEQRERVKVTNQQWQLLIYLINQAPRLISKDELQDKLWRNAFVTDEAVSQAIRNIRNILKDQRSKVFIQTEHGRGYRFIGKINRIDTAVSDESSASSTIADNAQKDDETNNPNRDCIHESSTEPLINQYQANLISDAISKWSGSLDDKIVEHLSKANIQIGVITNIIDRFFSDIGFKDVPKDQLADRFKDVAERYIRFEKIQGNDPLVGIEDIISGVSIFERVVICIRGKDLNQHPIWTYIHLTLDNLQRLRDAVTRNENFHAEHFGRILASGTGEIPFEVQEEMRILYNMIPVPKT